MITTRVHISNDGSESGALLQQYLQDRGVHHPRGPATVCYGLSTSHRPALNGSCQSSKVERMRRMEAAGVSLVPWADTLADAERLRFPLYARRAFGMGAKDLMPVFQREEVAWRIEAGWAWFSSIVPIERELRVWVWRGEVLDIYEKIMQRPAEYTAMGRNFGQGFEFRRLDANNDTMGREAILATDALGLDFAAIDLIVGKDGVIYVLEANTAGGVLRSKAQSTMAKLADRIDRWCRDNCPERDAQERPSHSVQRRLRAQLDV